MRYTSQTQTEKPVITADIISSLTELINEAHSAVPQDLGVFASFVLSTGQALCEMATGH